MRAWLMQTPTITLIATLTAAMSIVACGGSTVAGCTPVPRSIPQQVLAAGGAKLAVHTGQVVFAVLVEDEELSGGPGFPWATPRSSDPRVLAPVRLCKLTGASSLAVAVSGFRALRPGHAALFAPLTAPWRAETKRPAPYRAQIRVLR